MEVARALRIRAIARTANSGMGIAQGRRTPTCASPSNILRRSLWAVARRRPTFSRRRPSSRGAAFTCHATERGGRATYHAPGQLVLYPIVNLARARNRSPHLRGAPRRHHAGDRRAAGVAAHRDARGHGIWTERGKLGAVGIRVREGISMHGLALNVSLDLSGYALIAPCGVRGSSRHQPPSRRRRRSRSSTCWQRQKELACDVSARSRPRPTEEARL